MVCAGGAIGSGSRYLLSIWIAGRLGVLFPVATLSVNILGSFLLAFLMQVTFATEVISPELRLGLTAGVMGGFTTYSTFNYETSLMMHEGSFAVAALYVAATLLGCLVAGWIGYLAGRMLVGA